MSSRLAAIGRFYASKCDEDDSSGASEHDGSEQNTA
jgi:hypothetical protein